MTVDEAFEAASRLLEQRGQLLNGHLLRLVEGDKDLFKQVRERLILEGLAEDRSGIGLAGIAIAEVNPGQLAKVSVHQSLPAQQLPPNATSSTLTERSNDLPSAIDWWLTRIIHEGYFSGKREREQEPSCL